MTDPTRREPTPTEVAAFLRRNPDFLLEFPDLSMVLKLPRQLGASTSLASYQLDVLRDKNRALNRRLQELVTIATENEQLVMRVHALTLALMRAGTLTETLQRVVATLHEDFAGELVRLALFQPPKGVEAADWLLFHARDDKAMHPFAEFFNKGEPLCGRLNQDKLNTLFSTRTDDVKSAVLMPITGRGLLAIGSTDANRFHPGMGTLFLKLIAEAVGAALARFEGA